MTRIISPLLSMALVALSGCGLARAEHAEKGNEPRLAVPVATAHVEQLNTLYYASGTVHGRNTATLTSKTMGYVRNVRVKAGDRVTAGQELIDLEANDVAARVHGASTGIDQAMEAKLEAENGLASAQAQATNAKEAWNRSKILLNAHAIPQQAYDDAEARWRSAAAQEEMARARVRATSARIEQAKAELTEAKVGLGYAKITAPFAGRIVERRVDPGNLASPGMPLVVLEQDDGFRVEAPVEESRAASVHLGDLATVELGGQSSIEARVDEIVPNIDVNSRASLVKLSLPANATGLRPGMFARVAFHIGQREGLVVPTEAVNTLGALERVYVIEGEHARLRMINTGEASGPWTEILSGLSPDEPVVAAAPPNLPDGALIARAQ